MEAKKNPSKDLTRKSGQFFLIGLSISISLMITAFEWRTEKIEGISCKFSFADNISLIDIPNINIKIPKPPKEVAQKKQVINLSEIIPIETITGKTSDPQDVLPIDSIDIQTGNIPIDIIEIPEEDPIVFAEVQPQPVGGIQNFYKELSEKIKYPNPARRMNIEGKVLVEFVVNKKGEPCQFKIIKGIGAGCDEEAMRVIALSKWEPGKQRGIPVRVKMTMPIYFKLN